MRLAFLFEKKQSNNNSNNSNNNTLLEKKILWYIEIQTHLTIIQALKTRSSYYKQSKEHLLDDEFCCSNRL